MLWDIQLKSPCRIITKNAVSSTLSIHRLLNTDETKTLDMLSSPWKSPATQLSHRHQNKNTPEHVNMRTQSFPFCQLSLLTNEWMFCYIHAPTEQASRSCDCRGKVVFTPTCLSSGLCSAFV